MRVEGGGTGWRGMKGKVQDGEGWRRRYRMERDGSGGKEWRGMKGKVKNGDGLNGR